MSASSIFEFCAKAQVQPRQVTPLGFKLCADHFASNYLKASKSAIRLQRNLDGRLQISVSTAKHVNAHTFLTENVEQIRTNFIHEGKMTIHMEIPPVDLLLRDGNQTDLNALVNAIQKEPKPGRTTEEQEARILASTKTKKDNETSESERRNINKIMKSKLSKTQVSQVSMKPATAMSKPTTGGSIPKLESRKRGASTVTSFDDHIKRLKTEVSLSSASVSNNASKKQKICLDLTKAKVESDRESVNRILRDTPLQPPMLKVTRKKEYPKNGLWHSLKGIEATGLCMRKIDIRMNPLKNLSCLNLSSNLISSIEPLMSLTCRLTSLTLDFNPIEFVSPDFFLAPPLISLAYISFKNLALKVLPRSIVNLQKLGTLHVSKNSLIALPYNMNLMTSLTRLHVNDNKLTFLPVTIKFLQLIQLDISGNNFQQDQEKRKIGHGPFPTLLELAAESLKAYNMRMNRLGLPHKVVKTTPEYVPQCLHDVMEDLKWCSKCDRMVARYTLVSTPLHRRLLANGLTHDNQASTIPVKFVICDPCQARA